jgi:zinc/manganese transport system ATP-binding protein
VASVPAVTQAPTRTDAPVALRQATLRFGARELWAGLDLDIAPGEFVAVLGPNGSGKTSLLKVLLGLQRLTSGSVTVCGRTPRRGSDLVGYVPQQKAFDRDIPLRGRDLVRLGLDGHRWGVPWPSRAARQRVDRAIESVGATAYADAPLGLLSGGEQQRLRIAQALLGDPRVLLCDEPLLSLDLHHQQATSELIDRRRRESGTSVLFVTHEINPVLPMVDRVLYLVGTKWAIGTPDEVLRSERLSELYGTHIDVLRVHGRVVVVGAPDAPHGEGAHHHHERDDDHELEHADGTGRGSSWV